MLKLSVGVLFLGFIVVALFLTGASRAAVAVPTQSGLEVRTAELTGYQEVPAISTTGIGSLLLNINDTQTMISYTLNYQNLQGGAPSASHIHFGQPGVNGGVSAFLCGGGGKPACPTPSGPISGTILASDVVGPSGQGIAAGELAELIAAIRAGVTYANVHTPTFPGGEIRGRIR